MGIVYAMRRDIPKPFGGPSLWIRGGASHKSIPVAGYHQAVRGGIKGDGTPPHPKALRAKLSAAPSPGQLTN